MPAPKPIPYPPVNDLVTYTVIINDREVAASFQIMSITVLKEVNRISFAKIILLDGEPASRDFPASNDALFVPGNKIDIQAGYNSTNQTIFKGIIIKHAIKIRGGSSLLNIECKDEAVKMTVGRKSNYFADKTDSTIVEELINKYRLNAEIEPTNVQHKELVQFDSTDWDFMITRMEANGKVCLNDDGKIMARKPKVNAEPLFDLTFGENIFDFDAEIDARNQVTGVKASAWSYSDQALAESEGAEPVITEEGNLPASDLNSVINLDNYQLKHSGKLAQGELQSWADAQLMKNRFSKIRGNVKFKGFSGVKPGDTIRLNGVGDRFNGLVYISGVRHSISKGDWKTDLQFGLQPEWFMQNYAINHLPAAALLPSIHGLHLGVVTDLEDPDGEDRVRVRVPVINPGDDGVWARVSTLDAGSSRGMFFRPELNDEVVLGFVNNDPRYPIILGMLNSSALAAPLKASNSNPQKGYTSREGMKFIFDDEKKSVTLETPAGKKIVVDESEGVIHLEDENSNKITMSAEGIKIEAAKKIDLKAGTDLSIQAMNITLKCDTSLKIDGGASAEMKSSGTMKMEGGASTEVSSSGVTKVKGSVVMIN